MNQNKFVSNFQIQAGARNWDAPSHAPSTSIVRSLCYVKTGAMAHLFLLKYNGVIWGVGGTIYKKVKRPKDAPANAQVIVNKGRNDGAGMRQHFSSRHEGVAA